MLTEDSDYARLQDELKARRVKHQKLIEDMILKRDYILEYMERNKRSLSLTARDVQTFRTLLTHVTRVQDNPQSRYFKVFNELLMSNPELATKVAISLERMEDEMKERRLEEARQAVREERREQAMAVVEAAYNKIKMGISGKQEPPYHHM